MTPNSLARRPWRIVVACLGAALLAGCVSGGASRAGDGLALHLLHSPAALNLDEQPGPDGFALKVFAISGRSSKGAPLPAGELEILMFDGALRAGAPLLAPRKVWRFGVPELRSHETLSSLGTGYEFLLRWGADAPVTPRITVLARHRNRQNQLFQSAPSIISVSQP